MYGTRRRETALGSVVCSLQLGVNVFRAWPGKTLAPDLHPMCELNRFLVLDQHPSQNWTNSGWTALDLVEAAALGN